MSGYWLPEDATMSTEPVQDTLTPSITYSPMDVDVSPLPEPAQPSSPQETHLPAVVYPKPRRFISVYELELAALRHEVLQKTKAYLAPTYSPDGEYYTVERSARLSVDVRYAINMYFGFKGRDDLVLVGNTRAEGFRRFSDYCNGRYPDFATRRPMFDVDARDALSFELSRDDRPGHAIPVHDNIYEFILQSRSNPHVTFDNIDTTLIWLKLDDHRSAAVEFEDRQHRQHVQLLFFSAFMRPFVEPDQ